MAAHDGCNISHINAVGVWIFGECGKNVQIKREWLGKNIGAMSTCHIVCEITQIFVSLQVYWTFFLSRQILNENHGGIENMNGLDYHGPFFKQLSILYVFFFQLTNGLNVHHFIFSSTISQALLFGTRNHKIVCLQIELDTWFFLEPVVFFFANTQDIEFISTERQCSSASIFIFPCRIFCSSLLKLRTTLSPWTARYNKLILLHERWRSSCCTW